MTVVLPAPPIGDPDATAAWVEAHLGDLTDGRAVQASPRFRGTQEAADAALAGLDVTGYARRRNEVWPTQRRGATALSPWIRHGLLPLTRVWDHVADAPAKDRSKLRDELTWQEYARHLHARLGPALGDPLRARPHTAGGGDHDPWDRRMACTDLVIGELETDGWMVNQKRMWMASQWSVRGGADWRSGEDRFFRHLLDGSRAANRLGWQWTIGTGTGARYGFSRRQVERRAPGLCDSCQLVDACPIADWPETDRDAPMLDDPDPRIRRDHDLDATAGPRQVIEADRPAQVVWLTAESLGDADPALDAHPDLPVAFTFDEALLSRLRLSGKRLVFIAEALGSLGQRRDVTVARGDPVAALADRPVAVTFAPVPGFHRRRARVDVAALHPWPWLRWPHARSVQSFSAWRKGLGR